MVDETAKATQTKLLARVSNGEEMRVLGRAVSIAIAQKRLVKTFYERDWADWMCWVVIID